MVLCMKQLQAILFIAISCSMPVRCGVMKQQQCSIGSQPIYNPHSSRSASFKVNSGNVVLNMATPSNSTCTISTWNFCYIITDNNYSLSTDDTGTKVGVWRQRNGSFYSLNESITELPVSNIYFQFDFVCQRISLPKSFEVEENDIIGVLIGTSSAALSVIGNGYNESLCMSTSVLQDTLTVNMSELNCTQGYGMYIEGLSHNMSSSLTTSTASSISVTITERFAVIFVISILTLLVIAFTFILIGLICKLKKQQYKRRGNPQSPNLQSPNLHLQDVTVVGDHHPTASSNTSTDGTTAICNSRMKGNTGYDILDFEMLAPPQSPSSQVEPKIPMKFKWKKSYSEIDLQKALSREAKSRIQEKRLRSPTLSSLPNVLSESGADNMMTLYETLNTPPQPYLYFSPRYDTISDSQEVKHNSSSSTSETLDREQDYKTELTSSTGSLNDKSFYVNIKSKLVRLSSDPAISSSGKKTDSHGRPFGDDCKQRVKPPVPLPRRTSHDVAAVTPNHPMMSLKVNKIT